MQLRFTYYTMQNTIQPENYEKQNKKYKNDAVVGKFILCVSIQQAYMNCAYGWVMRVARLRTNIIVC